MNANGIMYLGKSKPVVDATPSGDFRLQLLLVDNLGANKKEAWRVAWTGPQARDFWHAHQADLQPGAIVRCQLEHIRVFPGTNTYPPMPELRARAISIEICPKRLPNQREQLSNQERQQQHAAA